MMTMRAWVVLALILLMSLSFLSIVRINVALGSKTIFVPTDFLKIQDAIDNATEGDTVFVYSGTYFENLIVNKTISLVGENRTITFVDGGGFDAAVTVTANNVSISGFTMANGSASENGAGILLYKVQHADVSDNAIVSSYAGVNFVNSSFNIAQNNQFSKCNLSLCLNFSDSNSLLNNIVTDSATTGIDVNRSSNSTIMGNSISNSNVCGIYLKYSSLNKISANTLSFCESGMILENSGQNILRDNIMQLNKFNFRVTGTSLTELIEDADTSNKVDGKSIYYLVNKNGFSLNGSLSQSVGYLAIVNSSNVKARDLDLSKNGDGFLCAYSSDCTIGNLTAKNNSKAGLAYNSPRLSLINSSFVDNGEGISLVSSPNGIVRNSSIVRSGGMGLRLTSSGGSIVEENIISNSAGGGLNIFSSSNCNASKNSMIANTLGILVQGSNNVRIVQNIVTNNTGDAIYFSSSDNCMAQANNVSYNAGYGIVFQIAQVSTAMNNRVLNSSRIGIFLYNCNSSLITLNFAKYNEAGINLQSSPNSKVNENEASENAHEGIRLTDSANSTISNNTLSRNYWDGIALQSSQNCTLERNIAYGNAHFGIWLQDSPSSRVLSSNISSNGWDGVYVRGSDFSKILNSCLDANGDAGCRLYSSNLVTVSQNNMSGNDDGIRIFLAHNNTVTDNKIMQNQVYGVYMFNSTGNKIHHNNFVNNTQNVNVFDVSGNVWDDGYPSGGNFWSNYTGVDVKWGANQDQLGSDGIGDIPYIIDSENKDRYPIMTPSRFHDLTIENVTLPSSEVYEGWVFPINVTVKNNGGYVETFNVTADYNGTYLETRIVSNLTSGASVLITLTWNTSGLPLYSVYDFKAEVSVISGEAQIADNVYDFGIVRVKMVGDVNSDKKINILDIAAVATGFGSKLGDSQYKLNYDLNLDYVINIVDVTLAARNYGKTYS
jgi:parallel beta-helix repeat protein